MALFRSNFDVDINGTRARKHASTCVWFCMCIVLKIITTLSNTLFVQLPSNLTLTNTWWQRTIFFNRSQWILQWFPLRPCITVRFSKSGTFLPVHSGTISVSVLVPTGVSFRKHENVTIKILNQVSENGRNHCLNLISLIYKPYYFVKNTKNKHKKFVYVYTRGLISLSHIRDVRHIRVIYTTSVMMSMIISREYT